MNSMLENNRIFITGAAGSIGSGLVRQLVDKNRVCCFDNNETELFNLVEELKFNGRTVDWRVGDIRNIKTLQESIEKFSPNIIFHAAAYKHVTPMEMFPEEAVYTNIIGTLNVVETAIKRDIPKLILISTDKVVNYNSVMGVSKRLCELIVRNAGFISVRFANVLGSRGSVIPIWQKQIDEGEPLTITDPRMERYFMTIEQAVQLVISASVIGEPGDIIVLDMGKPINILDLAKQIIRSVGKNVEIKEVGIRPGEELTENLMTKVEALSAIKKDDFWIIKQHD